MKNEERNRIYEEEKERISARRYIAQSEQDRSDQIDRDFDRIDQLGRWGVFTDIFYTWIGVGAIGGVVVVILSLILGDAAPFAQRLLSLIQGFFGTVVLAAVIGLWRGIAKATV